MEMYDSHWPPDKKEAWRTEMDAKYSSVISDKAEDEKLAAALKREEELALRREEEERKKVLEHGQINRTPDAKDFRPDIYRTPTEDVVANPMDDGEGFQKRNDYDPLKAKAKVLE